MRFDVEVRVMPRATLLDPQGQAVEHALQALGFERVSGVRVGRALTLQLERADAGRAEADARAMCQRLLANPVTEDFTLSVRATS
ncbi:MAG: phosphoribosylformylglycinamidine synthase subunit PurS [Gemmatimonadetes bacterium]|nr:phosphoribosylformylglycinamidine synthase subunit PurS [Gemmatimonadota bacterium]MBI2403064.1 phosphoribosylformylglycinamidine synthase subunit PurS [Gemmatimonadota bacterium]MBI2536292.1 phosphoribosylformylglycinamidine synthase subunit PurS [Gemmatimonadota bacterium]MBI2615467.1 phosphoribosylformylglycinamidine synthase subunit PurS [Gemmatimonadota bacterium]